MRAHGEKLPEGGHRAATLAAVGQIAEGVRERAEPDRIKPEPERRQLRVPILPPAPAALAPADLPAAATRKSASRADVALARALHKQPAVGATAALELHLGLGGVLRAG